MSPAIAAAAVQLHTLAEQLNLREQPDAAFFPEWQTDLPALDDWEQQGCDRLRAGYFNLLQQSPARENAVRLTVLHPLLFLANFYLAPWQVQPELATALTIPDEDGTIIEGRLDVLVLHQQFWLLAVEAKRASIAIEAGLAQLLVYMLASPNTQRPVFGLITNGGYFQFAKLQHGTAPEYGLSDVLVVRRQPSELDRVLQILKRLAGLSLASGNS